MTRLPRWVMPAKINFSVTQTPPVVPDAVRVISRAAFFVGVGDQRKIDKSLVLMKNGIFTAAIAQSVRASDCGSEGRGFEPHLPPVTVPSP